MVQGGFKAKSNNSKPNLVNKSNSAKIKKQQENIKKVKIGSTLKLPNGRFREHALLERDLSKAIDKANEQKVASKLIQGGGKLGLKDIMQKGKELNKEIRRNEVKKKKTRIEEKLVELKSLAELKGEI